MARGRKPRAGVRAERRVTFRVTADEHASLVQFAAGAPLADVIRLLVMDAVAEAQELEAPVIPARANTTNTAHRTRR